MLTRKPKAALLALAVVLAGLVASFSMLSTSAADEVAAPVVSVVPAPVVPCAGVSQAVFAKRAGKVYRRAAVTRKAKDALGRMIAGACSPAAQSNMLELRAKLVKDRRLMFCRSPACNGRLVLAMVKEATGSTAQAQCAYSIIRKESGFDHLVTNHEGSGATGLGQALPASKMRVAGSDYLTNPATQIRWFLIYVRTHGFVPATPCGAWAYWQAHRSY